MATFNFDQSLPTMLAASSRTSGDLLNGERADTGSHVAAISGKVELCSINWNYQISGCTS
jgi:hypothetical protein